MSRYRLVALPQEWPAKEDSDLRGQNGGGPWLLEATSRWPFRLQSLPDWGCPALSVWCAQERLENPVPLEGKTKWVSCDPSAVPWLSQALLP